MATVLAEVEIGDRTYLIEKLSAEDQFHVFRRVMPLIRPIIETLKGNGGKLDILLAMSQDIASIPDEQLNYVIHKCLDHVAVNVQGAASLRVRVHGKMMFGDMDMGTMLQIMWAVIMENYRPFFQGNLASPSKSEAAAQETS